MSYADGYDGYGLDEDGHGDGYDGYSEVEDEMDNSEDAFGDMERTEAEMEGEVMEP
jgi:hypothetical protein